MPFEEKPEPIFEFREDVSFKDDSHRMFPNFKAIDEIFDKYSASLLACYLSDFV